MIGWLLCLVGLHKDRMVHRGPDFDWRGYRRPADKLAAMTMEIMLSMPYFECERCGRTVH
jgi:hypothetical protein